ncbi:uncharacterized protein LOC121422215 [Lytechinus variegatus]|uniref:uncharacterized protein LOC121422215 n=1 Tax=Lytechinus variegatus TaxID=7654 RepID=UPI001BB197EA|nr:uncharacterized protein LOC121422215 [Lytechinus variegatus]
MKLMDAIRTLQQKGRPQKCTRVREKLTIGVGWKEFGKEKCYKQVRSQSGGGTISITVKRGISYRNLLDLCIDKFFPHGKSANGISTQTRNFFLGNNQGLSLEENFVLDELYKENPKIRIYLHSKQKESEGSDSSSLPDPGLFSVDSGNVILLMLMRFLDFFAKSYRVLYKIQSLRGYVPSNPPPPPRSKIFPVIMPLPTLGGCCMEACFLGLSIHTSIHPSCFRFCDN